MMTKSEAIKILQGIDRLIGDDFYSDTIDEAVEMAIDALKCKPTVIRCEKLLSKEDFEAVIRRIHEENQNVIVIPYEAEDISTNTPMNREEAIKNIDYLKEVYKILLTEGDAEALYMAIEALKADTVEVVRCKDCRYANECHKSVQYTRNAANTVTIGYSPIEWCSRGERREK